MGKLTDAKIRAAKPKERRYKLGDGDGLWLWVEPSGRKLWRFRYRQPATGKDTVMDIGGRYPETSLAAARDKAIDARRLIADGKSPTAEKKAELATVTDTFAVLAAEWLAKQSMAPATLSKAQWTFRDLLKPIVDRPIRSIEPPDVLAILRGLEGRGLIETAHRTKDRAGQVFRYAIATGRAERDPTADLRGALAPVNVTHRAAVTDPRRVGELLRAIDGYSGQPATHYALRLLPLLFVRPGELRLAEWPEFDLEAAEPVWRIPAPRMKMREAHVVPLARQSVALLRELQSISHGPLLFPGLKARDQAISENTLNAALRGLGYGSDQMTAHGFRTIASTTLNEMGWNGDLIELQLAHKPRNAVRAAYNRAERLAERRTMMQSWADHLDALKASANVVPIRRA